MPGCYQRVDVQAVSVVIGTAGFATFDLSIPAWPGLLGLQLHQQAVVPDAGAGNPLGAVMSEATTATVGN